jgi:3-hydroxyacyl-CoA dehydrogenase
MTEIAVVGAGLIGHAPALVFAPGGHPVRLTDTNPDTPDDLFRERDEKPLTRAPRKIGPMQGETPRKELP